MTGDVVVVVLVVAVSTTLAFVGGEAALFGREEQDAHTNTSSPLASKDAVLHTPFGCTTPLHTEQLCPLFHNCICGNLQKEPAQQIPVSFSIVGVSTVTLMR